MKFKKIKVEIDGYTLKHRYHIVENNSVVGEIAYKPYRKNYVLLGYLHIFPEFQGKHFGQAAVDLLLKKFPNRSIVGETLKTSRGFWRKCIERYNGIRKNLYSCDNCSSSFVIPKRKISYEELWDCLMVGYDID
jgi:hypothetical protein